MSAEHWLMFHLIAERLSSALNVVRETLVTSLGVIPSFHAAYHVDMTSRTRYELAILWVLYVSLKLGFRFDSIEMIIIALIWFTVQGLGVLIVPSLYLYTHWINVLEG